MSAKNLAIASYPNSGWNRRRFDRDYKRVSNELQIERGNCFIKLRPGNGADDP